MVGIYVRVSSAEQAKEGYSIGEQTERLKAYCTAMDWRPYKVYTDPGFTGANIKRPALTELIGDVKAGTVNRVIVWKLDRLSRSQKDTLYLIEEVFLANKCDFVSTTENFDTATPFGRAMIGILAVFAQLERERIKERTAMGKEARSREGKWRGGGNVPIGYVYEDGELKPDPYESMQIQEMFAMFLSGSGTYKIASAFIKKGYTNKYGAWYERQVRRCLRNITYTGKVVYNGVVSPGLHQAIISEKDFEAVQMILETTHTMPGKSSISLLSRLIWCKRCGARYFSTKAKGKRYYVCHSRHKTNLSMVRDPNCKNDRIPEEELDEFVLDQIRSLVLAPSDVIEEQVQVVQNDRRQVLTAEIEKLKKQRSRLLDLYGRGEFSADELTEKVTPIAERRDSLQAELDALTDDEDRQKKAAKAINTFGDFIDSSTKDEVRILVRELIEKIEIDGRHVDIYWKF